MYWRVNCTEHLRLGLQTDSPEAAANGGAANGTAGGRRPRSQTHSADTRPARSASKRRAAEASGGGGGSGGSAGIVRWAQSPDGRLVAGITPRRVHLWLAKPFVLLSSLVYDAGSGLGELVDVVWEDPASVAERCAGEAGRCGTLFAVLADGLIYDIAVYRREGPVLEYRFAELHYFARGPGEGGGIPGFGIIQKRTYRLPSAGAGPAACAASAGAQLAVVATRSCVYRLTWGGSLVSSTPAGEVHDNPLAWISQVVCIECGSGLRLELYLLTDGAIRILELAGGGGGERAEARLLDGAGARYKATAIAYSAASRMLAVGTAGGEVVLWAVAAAADGRLERVARLGFDHGRGARVTALGWAPDGSAVACGYSTGHVAVRTALGYELSVTRLRSRGAGAGAGAGAAGPAADELVPAPALLAWAPGATRLLAFSRCVDAGGVARAQQGDGLPFARAALASMACEGNAKRVCLFTDDKVLVYLGGLEARGAGSQQPELQWHAAHIPAGYISANWPVRHVAVDDEGRHVAVAGRRGVAHYSLDTRRWRMFRSQQQEASLTCTGGLLWYQEYLVVACVNHECGDAPQVMFFSRRRALDTASDVQTVALAARAVALGCHSSMLLVLCEDAVVYQYAIFDTPDFVQVSFRRATSVAAAGVDPRRVRSLQWVPSAHFEHRPAFLVHEGTALHVIREGAPAAAVGGGRAEVVIVSAVNFGNMHSTVWWFDGARLHASLVSLEDFMDGGGGGDGGSGAALGGQRLLATRPEFFPVAISAERGMAVGVDQDWVLEEHAAAGLARLPVRAKLYLPSILDRLLSDGAEQDALLYAACFAHLEFFAHALEMLLHEVLEREAGGCDAQVLPRVVRLLEHFAPLYEVVVHCARKTEAAFWPRLFACLGGPVRVFRRCLAAGRLRTATQCLIVLHTLEPAAAVSEANVLALLDRTVAAQDAPLTAEILRFLRMAAESDAAVAHLLARLGADRRHAATTTTTTTVV